MKKIKHEKIRENNKEFHSKAKRKGVPYFDFAIIQQKWRSLLWSSKVLMSERNECQSGKRAVMQRVVELRRKANFHQLDHVTVKLITVAQNVDTDK